jgi:hypothetical protein
MRFAYGTLVLSGTLTSLERLPVAPCATGDPNGISRDQ